MDHLQQFSKARSVGVPIVGIETPDQEATISAIVAMMKAAGAATSAGKAALIAWDVVRGMSALNEGGAVALAKIGQDAAEVRGRTMNLSEALDQAQTFPDDAIVFIRNAHRFVEHEVVAQAVGNLRDTNKARGRIVVLLAPALRLPMELERDVVVLEEPLPNDGRLGDIIKGVYADAAMEVPDVSKLEELIAATRGLASFPAEQAACMALTKDGVDRAELWERKRKMIELTPGLTVERSTERFDDIGGIKNAKEFGRAIFAGHARPSCVVFVDEIEKSIGGATGEGGDSSGVAQDALGVLLKAMEDNKWTGQIAVGPPGCAKSMFAKALGASHNVPTISLDLGAAKGGLVGLSEQRVRGIVRVLKSVAGSGAYWVATCNRLETLPPELRRRFRFGLWYFDLPDLEERAAIWRIQIAQYKIRKDQMKELPDDEDWTGADIRNCCEIAWRLNSSLVGASQFVTPVAKSDPESIKKLRGVAHKRFLAASYSGVYDRDRRTEEKGRRITL